MMSLLTWSLICLQLVSPVWGYVYCSTGYCNDGYSCCNAWCCRDGSSVCCDGSCCSTLCCSGTCCANSYDYICSDTWPYCQYSSTSSTDDSDSGFPFWTTAFLVPLIGVMIYCYMRNNGSSQREARRVANMFVEQSSEMIHNISTRVQPQQENA